MALPIAVMGILFVESAYDSLNVARLANLPNEVITIAGEKSRTMEEETKQREAQRWFDLFHEHR